MRDWYGELTKLVEDVKRNAELVEEQTSEEIMGEFQLIEQNTNELHKTISHLLPNDTIKNEEQKTENVKSNNATIYQSTNNIQFDLELSITVRVFFRH